MQNKIMKNINPENFLQNAKQEFPCQSLESFSGEYYNMENKILNFQFGPVCTNQTRPNYSFSKKFLKNLFLSLSVFKMTPIQYFVVIVFIAIRYL